MKPYVFSRRKPATKPQFSRKRNQHCIRNRRSNAAGSFRSIQADDDQQKKNTERRDLLVLVPAAIAKFNEKGRDATKLKKNETVALLLSCYCVDTVAALKKDEKLFFIAKLQQEIDSDGTKIPSAAATVTAATAAAAACTLAAGTSVCKLAASTVTVATATTSLD
jgi:hypothetical protein